MNVWFVCGWFIVSRRVYVFVCLCAGGSAVRGGVASVICAYHLCPLRAARSFIFVRVCAFLLPRMDTDEELLSLIGGTLH